MENPEEILHSLEEFSKMKPKDIPRELEEYLCFVAKTGNPIYQWSIIKSLFREKLLNVITEFYEACPSVEIPPCPNVELFNYDMMKNFILEKLDTFASAPFTVQRICELLTTPRKEYNRIDKYMRALEKNILVVSTTEPGRRSTENGDGIMNGIESEHSEPSEQVPESSSSHDINIEDMDEAPSWPKSEQEVAHSLFENEESGNLVKAEESLESELEAKQEIPTSSIVEDAPMDSSETVITCTNPEELVQPYISVEPVTMETCATLQQEIVEDILPEVSVTITAIPANVEQESSSIERINEEKLEKVDQVIPENIMPDDQKLADECQEEEVDEKVLISEMHLKPTIETPLVNTENSPEELNLVAEKSAIEITPLENTVEETVEPTVSSCSEEVELDTSEIAVPVAIKTEEENEASEATEIKAVVEISPSTELAEEPTSSVATEIINEVDDIVDSSTDETNDGNPEDIGEKIVKDSGKPFAGEISDSEVKVTEPEDTPMDIDVESENKDKETECEEPSSSVETSL